MKFFQNKRNLFVVWLCVIMLASLASMMEMIFDRSQNPADIEVEVKDRQLRNSESDSLRPIIRAFSSNNIVKGKPYLKVENNFLLSFFAPGESIEDPVYALLVFTLCIIFLVRAKKIEIEKLFSTQLIVGIEWAGLACFAFALVDYWRHQYINKQIMQATDNFYHLERFSFFTSVLFWAGLFLSWLYRILKKAEVLQTEQELTV